MMNLSRAELEALGLRSLGRNVQVHRSAVLAGCEHISIGDHARVDCFSLISAGAEGVEIGQCVHIAAGCYLFGGGGRILMEDFSGLSSRVCLYTATDDYSGGAMTNPTVPDEFRDVKCGPITLRKHALIGAGSVVLPDVELGTGAAVGALTCVRKDVPEFTICVSEARRTKNAGKRGTKLLELEQACRETLNSRQPQ